MIGSAPKSHLTGVPGWETDEEQTYLLVLAGGVPDDGHILEVGGEFAMSASIFCRGAAPSVAITTIDLFPDYAEGNLLDIHRANLKEAGYAGRSEQIKANSNTYEWTGGPLDLLFIDADHNLDPVRADIRQYVRFVKVGGVVAFHDCANADNPMPHPLHFFVTQAVSEWFWGTKGKWQPFGAVRSILAFKRVK